MTETPDTRALHFLNKKAEGLTYSQIGLEAGLSGEAVRNVIRRFNEKMFGSYAGYSSVQGAPSQNPSDYVTPVKELDSVTDSMEELTEQEVQDMEIWTFDIERMPRMAFEWAPRHGEFTPEIMSISESRMISFAAKKLGGPTLFASEFHHGRKAMLDTLWHIFNRATIVVGFNSKRFDVPHCDSEFRLDEYPVYRSFKQIDLMAAVKQRFNYDYNTLKSTAKRWGLDQQKIEVEGFQLWIDCMAGDPVAWQKMKDYNIQDVKTTEAAYLSNLQWLTGSIPNLGLWSDGMVCPACASDEVSEDGEAITGVSRFKAYRCAKCGYRSRSNEKLSSTILRPITR